MGYRVTLIKGDGIGPEVTGATVEILAAAGAPIEWEPVAAGLEAFEAVGKPMPPAVLDSIRRNRVGLKGPLSTPKGGGYRSANVTLRKELELFTGRRPCSAGTTPGLRGRRRRCIREPSTRGRRARGPPAACGRSPPPRCRQNQRS